VTALVVAETVLLVLLVVLVAGLLRSHAEILRRLGPSSDGAPAPPSSAIERRPGVAAPPVAGTTTDGDVVSLSFEGDSAAPTLLAFLSSGCATCARFWESLGERRLPVGVQTVIVTRGTEREQPARLRKLAPPGVPVVMSSAAWSEYGVPGAPYFVLVVGSIRGEGVATTWEALRSLVTDAIEDERVTSTAKPVRDVDETLAAAGIHPDHPSLYPAGRGGS
jgi:hypothetical protein